MREVRLSLLGHKDHGKSTLIGRLLHDTGSITKDRINEAKAMSKALGKVVSADGLDFSFLLDSFEEEREGGFTLDTTRVQVRHKGAIFEMIDVPGHRELVRNMLSGASLADGAILIVSVKGGEGLSDETRLHLYLAKMLGIDRLIVAVNKMDCAGFDEHAFTDISMQIRKTLKALGFDATEMDFIPVSATGGDNVIAASPRMPWYRGDTILSSMESFSPKETGSRPMRLFVQDVYGDMVVGRLESGELSLGDEVLFEPAGINAKVDRMQSGTKDVAKAGAGQNIGLRLKDGATGIYRGCVCVPSSDSGLSRTTIEAQVFAFGSDLAQGETLGISCATEEGRGRISRISSRLDPTRGDAPECDGRIMRMMEAAKITFELDSPLVFEKFAQSPSTGRFILTKGGRVVAVGVVL